MPFSSGGPRSEKAALEVQDYANASAWRRNALRDIIGRTSLTELLRGRERIEASCSG